MYKNNNNQVYDGYWENNEKHGVGISTIPGKICKGWECWAHGRIIEVENEDWYGGSVDSYGVPHGAGTTLHKNGEVYDGFYEKGERNGYGTLYYPVRADGEVEVLYAGYWKNGLKHGEGLMREYEKGSCEEAGKRIVTEYKGYFANGVKEGLGVEMELLTGRWREGEWKNNAMCGHGKYFYGTTDGSVPRVRYEGNWENDKFHGPGVLWDDNQSVFRGGFKHGQRCGVKCDELYVDGSHYSGSFEDNARGGEGTMLFSTDRSDIISSYQGGWLGGRFHGQGVRIFPDGARYEGEYAEGKPHGIGCLVYSQLSAYVKKFDGRWEAGQCRDGTESYMDGTEYSGEMLDGMRHGRGEMVWLSGDTYKGEWRKGVMSGQGKYVYSNDGEATGNVYIGDWVDGKRHGIGSMTYSVGDVYDGAWELDERNGEGEMMYADGRIYVGSMLRGHKEGRGKQSWPEGSSYEGSWKGDLMHGLGIYRYADGRKYEGMFQSGRPHGDGVGTTSDERIYHKGNWEEGEPIKINRKGKKERSMYRITMAPVMPSPSQNLKNNSN